MMLVARKDDVSDGGKGEVSSVAARAAPSLA